MAKTTELGAYSRDCIDALAAVEIDTVATERILAARFGHFTAVGNIQIMGEPVAAGVKRRSFSREQEQRVAKELYFADKLLAMFPYRSSSLPLFTFAVESKDGDCIGILTEDFTHDGTRTLLEERNDFGWSGNRSRDAVPEGLHRDVYDALNGSVYNEAFRHKIGFAFDREVLIDYDDVAYPSKSDLATYTELAANLTVVI